MRVVYTLLILFAGLTLWTQWVSPIHAHVQQIRSTPALENSKQFQSIQDTVAGARTDQDWLTYLTESPKIGTIEQYEFVTYSVYVRNWRLKGISNLQTRLLPPPHLADRFPLQIKEVKIRNVDHLESITIMCSLVVETQGMTTGQLKQALQDAELIVSWDDLTGARQIVIPAQ